MKFYHATTVLARVLILVVITALVAAYLTRA